MSPVTIWLSEQGISLLVSLACPLFSVQLYVRFSTGTGCDDVSRSRLVVWRRKKKEGKKEKASNCSQSEVCQVINKTPRATSPFKIAIFIHTAPPSSSKQYPQYPDTKPQEGVVPASAGHKTGKLFISGASLFSESCFDWKIGHSFLADLCCQLCWHAAQFLPAPFPLLPNPDYVYIVKAPA